MYTYCAKYVVVTDGGISSARIISYGSGFQQGDVLGIGTIGATGVIGKKTVSRKISRVTQRIQKSKSK